MVWEWSKCVCLSISLALALPLEQRPKLSFLTPPFTCFLNSLMKFIILAGIQFNSILIIFLFIIHSSVATVGSFPHLSFLSHWVLRWRGFVCPLFHYFLLRLWNTQTRLLGQAGSSYILFSTLHTLFSPPSQSQLISVPSWSQGMCGRVEKPNWVFPQYMRFSYFLSLSLLWLVSKALTKNMYHMGQWNGIQYV